MPPKIGHTIIDGVAYFKCDRGYNPCFLWNYNWDQYEFVKDTDGVKTLADIALGKLGLNRLLETPDTKPPAYTIWFYAKSDNKLYYMYYDGVERELASGDEAQSDRYLIPPIEGLVIEDHVSDNDVDMELLNDDVSDILGHYYKLYGRSGSVGKQGVKYIIRTVIPSWFESWSDTTAINIYLLTKTTNTADNSINLNIGKSGDSYDYTLNDIVSDTADTWKTVSVLASSLTGYEDETIIEITLDFYSDDSNYCKFAGIELVYAGVS